MADSADFLASSFSSMSLAASAPAAAQPPFSVALIHGPEMQAHAPPQLTDVYELPCRIVAIECQLRGEDVETYVTQRTGNLKGGAAPPVRYHPAAKDLHTIDQAGGALGGEWVGSPPKGEVGDIDRFQHAPINILLGDGRDSAEGEVAFPDDDNEWVALDVGNNGGLWAECRALRAPRAMPQWVSLVHTEEHIREQVRRVLVARSLSNALQQGDMFYGPLSLTAALHAVGGAVEAVRCLFPPMRAPDTPVASFAIVRPPGHHCDGTTASGFCLFSNTATAAAYARRELGLSRVAIVDTDYHPGDGSQNIFYDDPSVLTISVHAAIRARHPGDIDKANIAPEPFVCWPYSHAKAASFRGRGAAEGMNINIPWPHEYVDDHDYEEAMRTIIVPALRAFQPEVILWACGFDAAEGDKLAGLKLSTRGYFRIARHLAGAVPGVPLATILEGGYDPKKIALSAENVVRGLLGRAFPRGHLNVRFYVYV